MTLLERRNQLNPLQKTFWNDLFDREMTWPSLFRDGDMLPAINIRDEEQQYDIEFAVPGYKKNDFKVSVEKGILTVTAEVKDEKEENHNGFTRKEFSYKSFERNFTLPDNVFDEKISCKFDNGILRVHVPKNKVAIESEKKKVISIA
jgi:HSP20 family protein